MLTISLNVCLITLVDDNFSQCVFDHASRIAERCGISASMPCVSTHHRHRSTLSMLQLMITSRKPSPYLFLINYSVTLPLGLQAASF